MAGKTSAAASEATKNEVLKRLEDAKNPNNRIGMADLKKVIDTIARERYAKR
jgi:hypothetical protein